MCKRPQHLVIRDDVVPRDARDRCEGLRRERAGRTSVAECCDGSARDVAARWRQLFERGPPTMKTRLTLQSVCCGLGKRLRSDRFVGAALTLALAGCSSDDRHPGIT